MLDLKKHLATLAPDGITLPTRPLAGGWSEEVKADGHSHYFIHTGAPVGTQVDVQSLCGKYEGTASTTELDDCDPLAPENCRTCRRLLLERKNLI
jgi:hypothetical protein